MKNKDGAIFSVEGQWNEDPGIDLELRIPFDLHLCTSISVSLNAHRHLIIGNGINYR